MYKIKNSSFKMNDSSALLPNNLKFLKKLQKKSSISLKMIKMAIIPALIIIYVSLERTIDKLLFKK